MDRMSIRTDRCPTCGQAVQTRTSSEGTSCYLPTAEVERLRELCAGAARHLRTLPAHSEHEDGQLAEKLEAAAAGERRP